MTTTPPEAPAPPADAAATARVNAGARAKVLGWARRSIDLIPTSWLVTGGGAVLLATTAAFGGLQAVPVTPTPELTVGETFTGSTLTMTVRGVELRDERGNAGLYPDDEKGERLLVVELEVVNTFSQPRPSALGGPSPVVDGITIDGIDGKPDITHADDGVRTPRLQPGVPTPLLAAWVVGPDDFRDGDEVHLSLPDSTHRVGKSVVSGDYWDDVRVGAIVTAEVEEVPTP